MSYCRWDIITRAMCFTIVGRCSSTSQWYAASLWREKNPASGPDPMNLKAIVKISSSVAVETAGLQDSRKARELASGASLSASLFISRLSLHIELRGGPR